MPDELLEHQLQRQPAFGVCIRVVVVVVVVVVMVFLGGVCAESEVAAASATKHTVSESDSS